MRNGIYRDKDGTLVNVRTQGGETTITYPDGSTVKVEAQ